MPRSNKRGTAATNKPTPTTPVRRQPSKLKTDKANAKKKPTTASKTGKAKTPTEQGYEYDVCTSFAGENREFVEAVVSSLKRRGIKTFYDRDEQAKLWGKDLIVFLDEVYRKKSRHCLMFVSEHYKIKLWTNHERESAQARALQSGDDYILPVLLDDAEIPGLRLSRGHVDGRQHTASEVAAMVKAKLSGQPAPRRRVSKTTTTNKTEISLPEAPPPQKTGRTSEVKAPRVSPGTKTTGKVTDSGRWMLLGETFYQSIMVERKEGKYVLQVAPANAREEAVLRALEERPHWERSEWLPFAHGNVAARCRIDTVSARSEGGKHIYSLTLRPEEVGSNIIHEFNFNGMSAEETAKKRAEAIVLGKVPTTGDKYRDGHILKGYGSDTSFVTNIIATTLRSLGGATSRDNLQKARLATIYQLTISRVIEHVLDLSLGPALKGSIEVTMEGRRSNRTTLHVTGRVSV